MRINTHTHTHYIEDIVPKRFHEKTKERLSAANNSKLNVSSKVEASIHNNGFDFKTSFVLTNDIHHASFWELLL